MNRRGRSKVVTQVNKKVQVLLKAEAERQGVTISQLMRNLIYDLVGEPREKLLPSRFDGHGAKNAPPELVPDDSDED